jgi:hypothetical protein
MYKCKNSGCSWTSYRKEGYASASLQRQIQAGHDRHCNYFPGITEKGSKLRKLDIETSDLLCAESVDVVDGVDVVDVCLDTVDDKYLVFQQHLEDILQNPSQLFQNH